MTIKIDGIRVNVPACITASHVITPGGAERLVHFDADGTRWCDMPPKDAEALLTSSEPSCAPWRDANPAMFQRFGGQVRKPEPGIRIADRLAARDVGLRDPRDLGGISNDTLRLTGRRR
jgi:hypothetical protein